MTIIRLNPFKKDYKNLTLNIQKQTDKKIALLINNFRHPSLRVKRVQRTKDIWEGSITKNIRFTFQIIRDAYILRRVGEHDEVLRKP